MKIRSNLFYITTSFILALCFFVLCILNIKSFLVLAENNYIDNSKIPIECYVANSDGSFYSTRGISENINDLKILKYYSVATRIAYYNRVSSKWQYYIYVHRVITTDIQYDTNTYNLIKLGQDIQGNYIYDMGSPVHANYTSYVYNYNDIEQFANINYYIWSDTDDNAHCGGHCVDGINLLKEFIGVTENANNTSAFSNFENKTNIQTLYDLEVPQNVTCKYYDKKFDNSYYKITWQQSENINIQGWITEIYVAQKIKYGKYQWSVWTSPHTFESKYHFIDEVQNYLGLYKKIWSDSDLNDDVSQELYYYVENEKGYHPMSSMVLLSNFCIRNKYIDDSGNTHYSDYVYLKEDDNGNYTASVIPSQSVDDNGGITNIDYGNEDSIVDTNNDSYINSDVSSNTTSFSGGVSTIKSLFNDLKEFPSLLKDLFSFIPGQFFYALTALLIVLIPIAIIKLVL